MPLRSSVPALIPLSLLEALRNLDAPLDDGLDELANEVVSKRFGLSDTVAAQIERYQEAVEGSDDVPRDEALGVLRLVGRRADARSLLPTPVAVLRVTRSRAPGLDPGRSSR